MNPDFLPGPVFDCATEIPALSTAITWSFGYYCYKFSWWKTSSADTILDILWSQQEFVSHQPKAESFSPPPVNFVLCFCFGRNKSAFIFWLCQQTDVNTFSNSRGWLSSFIHKNSLYLQNWHCFREVKVGISALQNHSFPFYSVSVWNIYLLCKTKVALPEVPKTPPKNFHQQVKYFRKISIMNYCGQANACPALKANSFFSGWGLHIHG